MKTFVKLLIIIGVLVLVSGAILFSIGLSKNNGVAKESKTYLIENMVSNFKIDIDTSNIEFKISDDGTSKVVYEDTAKIKHVVEVLDNTLSIKQSDERKWYEFFAFGYNLNITVYLSEQAFNNLDIEASTGNISIPHDFSFASAKIKLSTGNVDFKSNVTNDIVIESSTGKITLSDIACKSLTASASTGRVQLENINVTEDVGIKTTTGRNIITNLKAENLTVTASTGKVNLKDTIINNKITVTTSTGDINFDKCDAGELEIEATTGDVEGTLLSGKTFIVDTSTGKRDVPQESTGGRCRIKTSTGDIKIKIL